MNNIVDSQSPAMPSFEEVMRLEEPPREPEIRWYHSPVALPKPAKIIYEDPELYEILCDFCRCMKNVVFDGATGRVTQMFCVSCRTLIGHHKSNHCDGGTPACVHNRFVDEVGTLSLLCRGCHRYGEDLRRSRRGNRNISAPCRSVTVK